ncbi:T cell activation RhoGTPase activating protein b isoform X2 [Nerophis ophidion]|uniref:T cell activation RhoGTPase activating protein b isoform X2 n=1 Tax=Nerophis ophidion TaxID=159077 RepID=UPI002ADF394F|nr:T cell activation RhoGTPase activating protein b isoform X2 [Nerophis ophidion]
MDPPGCGGAVTMRRGSYDEAAASQRPHFQNMAQRRRSAPSLVLGKALGIPWSPIRSCSYRVKHRIYLEDVSVHSLEDGAEHEAGTAPDADPRRTLAFAWGVTFCLVCFSSPEVKERWFDTLHSKIEESRARAACVSSQPDVLMKVLGSTNATKTLLHGSMEQVIDLPHEGDANSQVVSKLLNNPEDKLTQPHESKWSLVRTLKKGSSFISRATRPDACARTHIFGQSLGQVCPDDCSLPKPIADLLLLLRKRGPSTEGVFRKPCNNKNMKDIRDRLNAGLEVDLEAQPVVLLVGLLKSFLKELPGSLLVSELYEEWMVALRHVDVQQRRLALRRVVDKLPPPNRLLLQRLACVFHHVLESAQVNKMDAYNLAVCTAPTLLRLEVTPLHQQKEMTLKVTELTQFLMEHSEILGDDIPNLLDADEDSVSSQLHDSAYDSTDPEGDGEAGRSGSSPSLSLSVAASCESSDAAFSPEHPYRRRRSEPIILPSSHVANLYRSQEDFQKRPLKKQISDDSFWRRGRGGLPPGSFSNNQTMDSSSSSLESAASNQSEGSVFISSPAASPPRPRKPPRVPDEPRRSRSLRAACKVLMRTRSLGGFSRTSLKEGSNPSPCETLKEVSPDAPKPRPLSAMEVFRQVDSRLPCRPPPYERAVHNAPPLPPHYGSMTVHDAIALGRKSRPSSVNYAHLPSCSSDHQDQDQGLVFRQRAMSESVSRRCSQSAFQDFSYAKESYV